MTKICVVDIPPMDVVGTRKTGSYTLIPDLLMEVFTFIQRKNIAIAGPPLFLCHEITADTVRKADENGTAVIEVAWPVAGPVEGKKDITGYVLLEGRMIHTVHRGPYESCETTCRALFAWIGEHSLTICGPIREAYPNDPRSVPPEDIVTEIFIPVR